jgi:hypothetical protein
LVTRSRIAALSAGALVGAVLLTGCSAAEDAIDRAQGVVDEAQSLVDSAASLAAAPQGIAEACENALAGLAPGTPLPVAQAAVDDALTQVDAALGPTATLPIVGDLRDVLASAAESLVTDSGSATLAAARESIQGACSVIP